MISINKEYFDEQYSRSIVTKIDKINEDLDIVKDLDKQIKRLTYQRSLVLENAAATSLEICNIKNTMMFDPQKVEDEYSNKGFKSDTVKTAVAIMRTAFFDDTKEEFKKFSCVEIDVGDNYDHSMKFEFSDDSGCDIGISIPDKRFGSCDNYSESCCYSKCYGSRDDHKYLIDNEFIDCAIAFYIKYDLKLTDNDKAYIRHMRETIAYSKSMFDIRKAINDFVFRDKTMHYSKYPKREFKHFSFLEMIGNAIDLNLETRNY